MQGPLHTSEPTAPDAPCTGSVTYSGDNCTVTYSETCPDSVAGSSVATLTITGNEHWSVDASQGTGTLQITGYDSTGAVVCEGVYTDTDSRD